MNRRKPSHLRLHVENSSKNSPVQERPAAPDEVAACLKSFAEATGWAVRSNATKRYSNGSGWIQEEDLANHAAMRADSKAPTPKNDTHSSDATVGRRWRLVDAAPMDGIMSADDLAHFPTVTLEHAEHLLVTIEELVIRLEKAENALRRQEAELATGVSVSRNPDEQVELADRIEAILAGSAKSVHAVAAAVYLLDETTTNLKMRACWGLPTSKLAEPARPLRGSLGDLEALLGNAVLLEDTHSMPDWPSPEDFASAIVVPIGSSTMPHGTIWFWSEAPRKHSMTEIEVANLAAGRIMGELEQSLLGNEVKQAKTLRKQIDAAGNAQAARLPDSQPLHKDFQFDGWTYQDSSMGGGFHDWDITPNGMMVASVGSASGSGPQGALVATSVQSVVKTLWPNVSSPAQILRGANDVLWGACETDWTASSALFQINPETGYGSVAIAGLVQAFIVSQRGFRPIGSQAPCLAQQPDVTYTNQRFVLQPNEVMIAFSDTVVKNVSALAGPHQRNRRAIAKSLDQNELLQSVRQMIGESSSDIASHLARMLPSITESAKSGRDRSLIVIQNCRKSVSCKSLK
ncbi:MAG: SpoIIE family protein phosphatase [Pirellulaceae bacterium]|nr:SpoIIE family protein phosphatase [Pirellulaceae bacterium]